jgi:phosphoglucomutase
MTKDGWFAARPSGSEDVYKIYAESFRSEDHLTLIQGEAQTLIFRLFSIARSFCRCLPFAK